MEGRAAQRAGAAEGRAGAEERGRRRGAVAVARLATGAIELSLSDFRVRLRRQDAQAVRLGLAAVAIGLMVVGSLGPWAKDIFVTDYGLDRDGAFVIGLAGLAALVLATPRPPGPALAASDARRGARGRCAGHPRVGVPRRARRHLRRARVGPLRGGRRLRSARGAVDVRCLVRRGWSSSTTRTRTSLSRTAPRSPSRRGDPPVVARPAGRRAARPPDGWVWRGGARAPIVPAEESCAEYVSRSPPRWPALLSQRPPRMPPRAAAPSRAPTGSASPPPPPGWTPAKLQDGDGLRHREPRLRRARLPARLPGRRGPRRRARPQQHVRELVDGQVRHGAHVRPRHAARADRPRGPGRLAGARGRRRARADHQPRPAHHDLRPGAGTASATTTSSPCPTGCATRSRWAWRTRAARYFEYAQSPVSLLAEAIGRAAGMDAGKFAQDAADDAARHPRGHLALDARPGGPHRRLLRREHARPTTSAASAS